MSTSLLILSYFYLKSNIHTDHNRPSVENCLHFEQAALFDLTATETRQRRKFRQKWQKVNFLYT